MLWSPECPQAAISWYAALKYANRLSSQEGLQQCYALSNCRRPIGLDHRCDDVQFAGVGYSGIGSPPEAE